MLILPCIYAALIASVCWGVYYFAVNDFMAIWGWSLGHTKYALAIKVICSVTPLLAGGTIALFMVKPFFARRARQMQPLALDPQMEPRVYSCVNEICRLLAAPAPTRIQLDCAVNASAHFEGGWSGLFRNKLILTLGLPLVAGLSERELAGVIAHEFGHFRQGVGMRLSYVIRRVNGWFARVIYERDGWDETIESWAETEELWVNLMANCVRFGVWLSRRVLWVLMIVGHSICALLLRQMEYDADAAEITLAGSEAFESTTLKLAILGAEMSDVHREMRRTWDRQYQLPDNLPVLLAHRLARTSEERREKIRNGVGLEKTRVLDTHPSPADRVRAARRMAQPGFEISDAPATELFDNFDGLSRLVTLVHYEDDLNVPTSEEFLIPVQQLIAPTPSSPPPSAMAASIPDLPMMTYRPEDFQTKGE